MTSKGERRQRTERKQKKRLAQWGYMWDGDAPELCAGRTAKTSPLGCGKARCGICGRNKQEQAAYIERQAARQGA